jgi:hypothetical protein
MVSSPSMVVAMKAVSLSYGFGIALAAFLVNTIATAIGIIATCMLPQPKALQVSSALETLYYQATIILILLST